MSDLATMRTDVVGSLLRPDRLKQARRRFEAGEVDAAGLREVEDQEIRAAVALQESLGLGVVTDGEFRRLNFQDSFGACVEGFRSGAARMEILERQSHGGTALRRWDVQRDVNPQVPVWHRLPAVERLRLARNLPLEEYRYLGTVTHTHAKVALVGPDRISQRFDYENSRDIYPTVEDFLDDVVAIEKAMVASLVEAGCRYIQIDAPGYTAYVDEPSLEAMRQRGEDPDANLERSIAADNRILEAFGEAVSGHPSLPGKPAQHVAPGGLLRRGSGAAVRRIEAPPVAAGVRHGTGRRIRAAAVRPQGHGGGAGPGQHQGPGAGERGRPETAHRRRLPLPAPGATGHQSPVRLLFGHGGQSRDPGRPEAEARTRSGDGAAGVGVNGSIRAIPAPQAVSKGQLRGAKGQSVISASRHLDSRIPGRVKTAPSPSGRGLG